MTVPNYREKGVPILDLQIESFVQQLPFKQHIWIFFAGSKVIITFIVIIIIYRFNFQNSVPEKNVLKNITLSQIPSFYRFLGNCESSLGNFLVKF